MIEKMTIFFSLCALGFTIYSFYWMNWRPGKLHVTPPKTFAAACTNDKVIIYLPLVFHNSGARPIIVQNLQLSILDKHLSPLYFNATVEKLGTDEGRAYATSFGINANMTLELICEFQVKNRGFHFQEKINSLLLEAQINESKWTKIKTFSVYIGENALLLLAKGSLIVVSSDFE